MWMWFFTLNSYLYDLLAGKALHSFLGGAFVPGSSKLHKWCQWSSTHCCFLCAHTQSCCPSSLRTGCSSFLKLLPSSGRSESFLAGPDTVIIFYASGKDFQALPWTWSLHSEASHLGLHPPKRVQPKECMRGTSQLSSNLERPYLRTCCFCASGRWVFFVEIPPSPCTISAVCWGGWMCRRAVCMVIVYFHVGLIVL